MGWSAFKNIFLGRVGCYNNSILFVVTGPNFDPPLEKKIWVLLEIVFGSSVDQIVLNVSTYVHQKEMTEWYVSDIFILDEVVTCR